MLIIFILPLLIVQYNIGYIQKGKIVQKLSRSPGEHGPSATPKLTLLKGDLGGIRFRIELFDETIELPQNILGLNLISLFNLDELLYQVLLFLYLLVALLGIDN